MKKFTLTGVLLLTIMGIESAQPGTDMYTSAPTPDLTSSTKIENTTKTTTTNVTNTENVSTTPAVQTDTSTTSNTSKDTDTKPTETATTTNVKSTEDTTTKTPTDPTKLNADGIVDELPKTTTEDTSQIMKTNTIANPADEHNTTAIIGGWGGLSPDAKDSIKTSDKWKTLVNDNKGLTDTELYTLWLHNTESSTVDSTNGVSPLDQDTHTAINNAVAQALKEQLPKALESRFNQYTTIQDKEGATPEEVFASMMQKLDPTMTDAEHEAALQGFEKSLGNYTEGLQEKKDPDTANTVSIAADKDTTTPAA